MRNGLARMLEKKRRAAVEAPVREQFESELRVLTDAEQDSKELKSRKRDILYTQILDEVRCRSRSARAGRGRARRRTR